MSYDENKCESPCDHCSLGSDQAREFARYYRSCALTAIALIVVETVVAFAVCW